MLWSGAGTPVDGWLRGNSDRVGEWVQSPTVEVAASSSCAARSECPALEKVSGAVESSVEAR
jgi:hypothetical protein